MCEMKILFHVNYAIIMTLTLHLVKSQDSCHITVLMKIISVVKCKMVQLISWKFYLKWRVGRVVVKRSDTDRLPTYVLKSITILRVF